MSNRFLELQKTNSNFIYNNLNGLNEFGYGQSKIQIEGQLDHFTLKTLYESYNIIAQNLKVYPTIKIYPRGYEFEGGFGGFYHSSNNHINMIDHYCLISILSHEMRHAFQYVYFPDLYFSTEYNSARGYLNCNIERDARGYSLDYCLAMEYWEEAEYCKKNEEQNELVIQGKLPPSVIGLNDEYFRRNPWKASVVARTYHYNQNLHTGEDTSSNLRTMMDEEDNKYGCGTLLVIGFFLIIILVFFFK